MATNYLDTGDTGRAVSAESDGALFAGIFGAEKYVLENGSQLKAEVQSNNIVKISDGDAVMYGRHVRIPANDSALVTINNGHSGTNRIDLIVFRYTKDSTGKETVDLVVIQGEDSTGTATAPTAVDGNILTGAMQSDFPLYSVELNGINIVKVNPLFNVIGNISKLKEELTELNSKLSVYVLEEKECSPKDTGENQWKYRKWSNGSVEIWRIGGNVDTFTVSRSSANGIYYSDEIVWYPIDMPLKITKIDQILATIDRKGNDGLPNVNIVNAFTENGYPFIKFIITANRTGQFKVSTNFYIQARWK
ncbi:hypothetical protein [Coprococcus comes]|uniref:hypothetical protein n=1 Tax=Coprococcus comes TaxID=410072 RepID=UPI00321B83FA